MVNKHNHEREEEREHKREEERERKEEREEEREHKREEAEEAEEAEETPEPSLSDRLLSLLLRYKAGGGNNADSRDALNSIVELLVLNR